jgi:2-polyprenyl-6-methoxyphenol hydroxylase-like FAD-dependent oxidoreductase
MNSTMRTRCCIAGGGPAGIMLGYLLARAGIDVIVLEKWKDFLRDFRGDTIHPSTMEILRELGLLERFLALPDDEAPEIGAEVGGVQITVADFTHLPVTCKFIAFIPQWDFLDFIAAEARKYSGFHLMMETEATGLIERDGSVAGVSAKNPNGALTIEADLVIGADGRHSTIREQSGLTVESFGAPMDVLWFRLSRKDSDPRQPLGKADRGRILIMIARGTYWQCGYLIRKGAFDDFRGRGLDAFRKEILAIAPELADRISEIENLDAVKLLTVVVDRLATWQKPGLLCIGDAAHAMSPVGGVGINLAIQDAVAAANILVPAFRAGAPALRDLCAVQARRNFPTRMTQAGQVFVQNQIIGQVLGRDRHFAASWPLKLLRRFPILRRIPARIVGMGFRPEHIDPDLFRRRPET